MTYNAHGGTGQADTGFVTVGSVPCFVAGTLVQTNAGLRPVQRLIAAIAGPDPVSADQPLHWVLVQDMLAPMLFDAPEIAAAKYLVNGRTIRYATARHGWRRPCWPIARGRCCRSTPARG